MVDMEYKRYEINGLNVRFQEEPTKEEYKNIVREIGFQNGKAGDGDYDVHLVYDKRVKDAVYPLVGFNFDKKSGKLRYLALSLDGKGVGSKEGRAFLFDEDGKLKQQITQTEKYEETVDFDKNGRMTKCEIKDRRYGGYIEQHFDENGNVNRIRHWQWSGNDDWTVNKTFEKENAPQAKRLFSEKEEEKMCVVGNYVLNILKQNPELSEETQQVQQALEENFKLNYEPTNDVTTMMKNIGNSFMDAVVSGRTDVVSAMLDAGVSPNIKSENNIDTPLIASIRNGNTAMFSLLSSRGADFKQKNEEGRTPIDIALREKDKFFIDALKKEENTTGLKEKLRDLEENGAPVSAPTATKGEVYALSDEYTRGNDVSISIVNPALMKNKGR